MAEDVAQIEADGSGSDTCPSAGGEEIGPAKWGQAGSRTCSALVSVFKSPCAETWLLSSNHHHQQRKAEKHGVLLAGCGGRGCCHPLPSRLLGLAVHAE